MPALDWQTPLTITWPKPQPSRTCVIMLSGWEIGAGVIACTDVVTNKAKAALTINLIILLLPQQHSLPTTQFAGADRWIS